MDEILARIGEDLAGRITGPLTFRLILQPLVAIGLAIHAGIAQRRERPVYEFRVARSGMMISWLRASLRSGA